MSTGLKMVAAMVVAAAAGAAGSWYVLRSGHWPALAAAPGRAEEDHGTQSHESEGHDEQEDHEHDEHPGRVALSAEAIREFGVKTLPAGGGRIETTLRLPGEIKLNGDRVAHIVPRVSGIVREVRKTLGDPVGPGEVMAVLESRELAEAKAADLAAEARLELARSNLARVEKLVSDKVAPEKNLSESRQKLAEAEIEHRATEARLDALGVGHEQLAGASDFLRYEVKAPFQGTIVEKHLTLGEVVGNDHGAFVVADLSNVWAEITLYSQDAGRVPAGSKIRVTAPGPGGKAMTADTTLSLVSPTVREATRTGSARAVLDNPEGKWKPGQFITAEIVVGTQEVSLLVPNEALQRVENEPVVFVDELGAYEKRPVRLGRSDERSTEILSGLKPGERFVAAGAFILKAELTKGSGEHEH